MTKQLPKYWVIERDESNPLWDKYVEWFYKRCDRYNLCNFKYSGYEGNTIPNFKRYNVYDDINYFINNPTLITLEYWNECINGEEEKFEEGEEVEVKDNGDEFKGVKRFFGIIKGVSYCFMSDGDYNLFKYGIYPFTIVPYQIRKIKPQPKEIKLTATDSEIEKLKEFLKENNLDINIE